MDLVGKKFGLWTVLEKGARTDGGNTYWLCVCDCGTKREVQQPGLVYGKSRGCGCKTSRKYGGKSMQRAYFIWHGMIDRCRNPDHLSYHRYGGRGITVCERWLAFENFLADMGNKPKGLSLDRIDNDGPYCKENCRWATRKQQQRNMRSNRRVTVDGVTLTIVEWAERGGFSVSTIYHRLYEGLSEAEAVTRPLTRKKHRLLAT